MQRLAGVQLMLGGKSRRCLPIGDDRALGLRPAHRRQIGGFEYLAMLHRMIDSDGLDGSQWRCPSVGRLPVQGRARRQVDRRVETRRAPVVAERHDVQVARDIRLDIERTRVAVEFHGNVARFAEAVLTFRALAMRVEISCAVIVRLARVTTTSEIPRVSMPMS